jgi:chromatin structure-remodeling complex subunit RSC1/2
MLALQRLYHEATRGDGAQARAPSRSLQDRSTPGRIKPEDRHPSTAIETLYDSLPLKSEVYKIGDWVHLWNPDEPGKPIVGQIWKIFTAPGSDQRFVRACWYYRPEDTVHPAGRAFFVDEVFKTGHMIDHEAEDVLERCFVFALLRS